MYEPSAFRPHSSPDPFGATLSPGEGIGFFDSLGARSKERALLVLPQCDFVTNNLLTWWVKHGML